MKEAILFLLIISLSGSVCHAQEIREFMDLQTHPTMHLTYSFFSDGLQYFDENDPPKLTYKHIFTNVNFANYLEHNAGCRIIVHGAIMHEYQRDRQKGIETILSQLAHVNAFIDRNSDRFALAKSPEEVRDLVHNTDKTIVIHSIEGAQLLLNSQSDADFWARQGIAFMTLIHLQDGEFGGAATQPALNTKLINFKGVLLQKFRKKQPRGLTEKGRQAIQWLANAGIMTDLTHMSDQSRKDALSFMEAQNIPAIVTHDMFKPIQNQARGLDEEDVLRVYATGGFISLPISGVSLEAYHPRADYAAEIAGLEDHCPGSIDSYKFSYLAVKKFIEANAGEIREKAGSGDDTAGRGVETDGRGAEALPFDEWPESEKLNFAIGFQSDFNGWLDHSRPRYGKDGCREAVAGVQYEAIELEGLRHPGLLASQWRLLEKEGVDLEPIRRSSERFLQVWEVVRARAGK